MLNILLRKMWCVALQKCIFASNAFLHQMHFCTAEHFPLENVRWTFSFGKCTPKCIFASNAFVTFCVTKCTHQMHFCIKCICNILCNKMYASNAFLHQMHFCTAKMHFGIKCIFAKQNVTNVFDAKMYLMLCKNRFLQGKRLQDRCFYKIKTSTLW